MSVCLFDMWPFYLSIFNFIIRPVIRDVIIWYAYFTYGAHLKDTKVTGPMTWTLNYALKVACTSGLIFEKKWLETAYFLYK